MSRLPQATSSAPAVVMSPSVTTGRCAACGLVLSGRARKPHGHSAPWSPCCSCARRWPAPFRATASTEPRPAGRRYGRPPAPISPSRCPCPRKERGRCRIARPPGALPSRRVKTPRSSRLVGAGPCPPRRRSVDCVRWHAPRPPASPPTSAATPGSRRSLAGTAPWRPHGTAIPTPNPAVWPTGAHTAVWTPSGVRGEPP
jgi:hypothetical protein